MNTLLQDIEQSIQSAGGRVKLQYLLMKESRNWFSHAEHMEINKRLSKQISKDRRKASHPHELFWDSEDVNYLILHWGHKRSAFVAELLGRTVAGCRQKIKQVLGEQAYKQRVATGRYKTILNNQFKLSA